MEQRQLLGSSFDCTCGKHHSVPTEHLIYAEDAISNLPNLLQSLALSGTCLVIADARTLKVAGKTVEKTLTASGIQTSVFLLPDRSGKSPDADDLTRDFILEKSEPADIYIAVGSGVINDLVKWIAHLKQKPYVAVATAASMNGYGSANVAATIDGLKVLFHASAPKAVIVSPDIILQAPYELSTAGLGDVLAKPVSSADWRLNQYLFDEYYCQFAVDLLKDLEPVYLNNPAGILHRDPAGFKALYMALFYSSVAMTITGTSSPASGGEHLISHTLDILAGRDGKTHDFHGRQVGVASILTAALYERVMKVEHPEFVAPPEQVNSEFWGSLTPVVAREYDVKQQKLKKVPSLLQRPENWQAMKRALTPHLLPAEKLKTCLKKAEGAHRFSDIRVDSRPLDRDVFLRTVIHANQMRSRFTILDLALLLGILPGEIEHLIDRWLTE